MSDLNPASPRTFGAFDLIPGKSYQVIAEFVDYDGITQKVGDTWTYLRRDFLPYEDGLTLYIERSGQPGVIRLQGYPESQGPIVNAFSSYVREL